MYHIHTALNHAAQLQLTAQGLDGLRHWAEYQWHSGHPTQATDLFAYLLAHQNCSGFLARQIHAFLAQQTPPITLPHSTPQPAVAWQTYLPLVKGADGDGSRNH